MRSSHVRMNSTVKNWVLLKNFLFKYVFWQEGKSSYIWRKTKAIERYENLISRLYFEI